MRNFIVEAHRYINYYSNGLLSPSMMREVRDQYVDMASGGNGGTLYGFPGRPSCREYNYPEYPDAFFQAVCDGMGWSRADWVIEQVDE